MAGYYSRLDEIQFNGYLDIVINPMLDCLKNNGILIDNSKQPKIHPSPVDEITEYFLQAGGNIMFLRTTTYTFIQIDGIQRDSNITEDNVNHAINDFMSSSAENGYYFAGVDIKSGGSIK